METHNLTSPMYLQRPSPPNFRASEVSNSLSHSECNQSYIYSNVEVYRFLSSEVKAYLPSYETVTVWHLRDLAMGVKTIIPCDDIKFIDVPQF